MPRTPAAVRPMGRTLFSGKRMALPDFTPINILHWPLVSLTSSRRSPSFMVMACIPLLWNTNIWNLYFDAGTAAKSSNNYTLHDWVHPTLGHVLRESIPGKPFAAMFIPSLIIIPCTLAYYFSRKDRWDWTHELPLLTILSLIAAPYGAW